jgi:hypothetical protein
MKNKDMTLGRAWLWPPVSTRRYALAAINEAFWITICVAAFMLLFVLIGASRNAAEGFELSRLVVPLLLMVIAFGIRAKSRIAALAGFTVYVLSRLYFLGTVGPSLIVLVLITLALWHGVRGTFAYHRLAPIVEGTPSIEESFRSMKADPQTHKSGSHPS